MSFMHLLVWERQSEGWVTGMGRAGYMSKLNDYGFLDGRLVVLLSFA